MKAFQRELIELLVRAGALTFGDFTAKSGRRTPYFVNFGRIRTGAQLDKVAGLYADALEARLGRAFDVLFGPAYKGIPLAAATSVELARRGHDVGYAYNRKELKDHGEGGALVGAELKTGTRVVLIEDVTTAGTSIRETVPLLKAVADVTLAGLVVAVDRMEKGTGEQSALAEIGDELGMPAFAIVTIEEIVGYLREHTVDGRNVLTPELEARIAEYRARYGAR